MVPSDRRAIVVVAHGAAARDTPPELVRRLRAIDGDRHATHRPLTEDERALDARVRGWPRTPTNDPYHAGTEALVARMRALAAGARVEAAFNELCAPSIEDVVERLAGDGIEEIVLVPTMTTPGGVHSEVEIPHVVAALAERYPAVRIVYAWPFDLDAVARLLLDRVASSREA